MLIVKNSVTSVTASSADSSFPSANLLNEFPSSVWKAVAGVKTATLTFSISYGNVIFIGNTNAVTCTYSISPSSLSGSVDIDIYDDYLSYYLNEENAYHRNAIKLFTYQTTTQTIILTLTTTEATLEAGTIRAGRAFFVENPDYSGFSQTEIDHSVLHTLSNGNLYYKKRDVGRKYALNISEDQEEVNQVHQTFLSSGKTIFAIDLLGTGRRQDLILGRISEPEGNRVFFNRNSLNLQINEEI